MNISKLFILLFILISTISCSRKYEKALYSQDLANVKSRPYVNLDDIEHETKNERSKEDRKIIFNADISLTVLNSDSANIQVEKITKQYKGYINTIGSDRTVIRVKSDHLDDAIADLTQLGKITRKKVSGTDVTASYQDYEIRLENATKSRNRYLELLEKAETVEEIIKVEKELERLNNTIDLMKGQMNRINHLDAFSTITIVYKIKKKPGILGYIGLGLYHSVKWLFVRN